ncbi:MAG: peptide deformylase, partial [Longimicrobiales bacterium]
MIRSIRLLGDPILREEAAAVDTVDAEVAALIDDMFETMYDADGVGLAAPQIGVARRILIVDVREPDAPPIALVNPAVVEIGRETERAEEGCLSIPGLHEIVERPATCVVDAIGRDGRPVRLGAAGLFARALQHEIDHLDGLLFLDRVSPLKRRRLLAKWQKIRPEPSA